MQAEHHGETHDHVPELTENGAKGGTVLHPVPSCHVRQQAYHLQAGIGIELSGAVQQRPGPRGAGSELGSVKLGGETSGAGGRVREQRGRGTEHQPFQPVHQAGPFETANNEQNIQLQLGDQRNKQQHSG